MKLIIVGSGRMGHMIKEQATDAGDDVVMIIDESNIAELATLAKVADIVIDFSVPQALPQIAQYVKRTLTPLVSGTTGYNPEELSDLKSLGQHIPVLYSANYSFGVAAMRKILEQFSKFMMDSGFEAELVETHHSKKVDAPSGTAKLLLDAVDPKKEYTPIYGRSGICGERDKKEIGVHAVRGGTIAGTHSVTFYGEDESIEITHTATSRRIFAVGALNAAKKLYEKSPGLYEFDGIMF